MVTQFNQKDLVDFGNYLLSSERKQMFNTEPGYMPLEDRLKGVHHADVTNWLEKQKPNFLYTTCGTVKVGDCPPLTLEKNGKVIDVFDSIESIKGILADQAGRIESLSVMLGFYEQNKAAVEMKSQNLYDPTQITY